MRPRFQADADFNEESVSGLLRRHPEIDFQTAEEGQIRGLPDPEVLTRAAEDGRLLVTHDRRTMPAHFADFIQRQESLQQSLFSYHQSLRFELYPEGRSPRHFASGHSRSRLRA